ncbi:Uncharacterized protein dnm_003780 [Desulfonema magnum]|uniref:Uncharacterized protein n=1 Tax=Desulfonema magnum TaxID=45655 RepID=A0A975BFS3_9BACT|nr:Uncharacterized protein dnm_003780 [Desulfonema magnum]
MGGTPVREKAGFLCYPAHSPETFRSTDLGKAEICVGKSFSVPEFF